MVKMKGGGTGVAIVIGIISLAFIGGVIWLVYYLKCTEVTKECKDDDDCCDPLKCKNKKCCSPSTEKCSKDN